LASEIDPARLGERPLVVSVAPTGEAGVNACVAGCSFRSSPAPIQRCAQSTGRDFVRCPHAASFGTDGAAENAVPRDVVRASMAAFAAIRHQQELAVLA